MTSELVERAKRGDHEAFDAIATGAYQRLYGVATRILRDQYDAEDAVQDALLHAWRDIRGLRDPDRLDAWLHRLLVNACTDQARRSKRRVREAVVDAIDQADPTDEIARVGDRDELERAFLRLSVDQRAALVLTHYVGMSAADVADVLGIRSGAVYVRVHRGSRAMRRVLTNQAADVATAPELGR